MSGVGPVAGQAAVTTAGGARRLRLASPVTALVLGGLVLALVIADVPLAGGSGRASEPGLVVWMVRPTASTSSAGSLPPRSPALAVAAGSEIRAAELAAVSETR